MSKRLTRLMLLPGFALLVFIVFTIGPAEIWRNIRRISLANFMILLGLRLLYWMLRTVNWKTVVNVYDRDIRFYDLFQARMAGHAVSQLTPMAQVGGEAVRIMVLQGIGKKLSVSSVVVEKTIEFLSAVFFTLIGVAALFARFSLPMKTKVFFVGAVSLAALMVIFLQLKQRQGLLSWVVRCLYRLKIARGLIDRNRDKIEAIDRYISEFYLHHRGTFMLTFMLFALLTLLWVMEVHLNLLYIGADVTLADSFLITTLGSLSMMFPFIPASLGIYEITYAGLFVILGLNPGMGVTLVMIRRVIALVMAGVGLGVMFFKGREPSGSKTVKRMGWLTGFSFTQPEKKDQLDQDVDDYEDQP